MADIRVPTLGESVTEATIGKWFKKPGDAVVVDEPVEIRIRLNIQILRLHRFIERQENVREVVEQGSGQ